MGRPRELSSEERADLLRRGYRPVEIWVPDLENETIRRNSLRRLGELRKLTKGRCDGLA